MKIAVALLPAGKPISADRHHFHVARQKVIAGMSAVIKHTFEKHFALEPLADQPAVMVCEGDDHGSNLIALNKVPELFETQHSVQFGLWCSHGSSKIM